jgi:hypothetical protein
MALSLNLPHGSQLKLVFLETLTVEIALFHQAKYRCLLQVRGTLSPHSLDPSKVACMPNCIVPLETAVLYAI